MVQVRVSASSDIHDKMAKMAILHEIHRKVVNFGSENCSKSGPFWGQNMVIYSHFLG